jgi:hypothetical protein
MPSERATGLIFATVSLIATLLLRHFPVTMWIFAASSLGFLTLALAWPGALAPLNRAWFWLALLLNRFISPVAMFAIYATVIVPSSLIMQRLCDPLRHKGRGDRQSYWIERAVDTGLSSSSMRDQF